ncbi:MAG: PAP2-domain-containing protein [Lentinula lateritia]|nr:MAG: PAP2-domain-containing protein [Lentinula lateritia]
MSMLRRTALTVINAFIAAVGRLDKSLSPSDTLAKLRKHKWKASDSVYIFHFLSASFWLTIMTVPPFPYKLLIPILYTIAMLIPLTSQFFLPATPVFSWLIMFYSNGFIPLQYRPNPSVSLLPTLETVLYGANISDLLTRFTHPILDIIAWIPYGVGHYALPFVVAAFLWLFRPKEALRFWSTAFGYMFLIGVIVQILFPCAAPWYELIYGLTPANYGVKGSPGGLIRIDSLFHAHGYTSAFGNSPLVFGAFPSLHSGAATLEALAVAHFFPQTKVWVWAYAGVLYWATMYMTHHYLIDVVGGACLATMCFYFFIPDELKSTVAATSPPGTNLGLLASTGTRSKYDIYDLEAPRNGNGRAGAAVGGRGIMAEAAAEFDLAESEDDFASETGDGERHPGDEEDITYRPTMQKAASNKPNGKNKSEIVAGGANGHRHTASIARLIRGPDVRGSIDGGDEGWRSPMSAGFVFPPRNGRGKEADGKRSPIRETFV